MHNSVASPDGIKLACDGIPPIGGRREVAPGIFWIRMPLPFTLNHINLWAIRDGTGWVLVDCGHASPETKTAWETLLPEFSPVTRIIVTHFHPDHVGLAGWLAGKTGAPVHMASAEFRAAKSLYTKKSEDDDRARREHYRAAGVRSDIAEQIMDCHRGYQHAGIDLPVTVLPVSDDQTFMIGGRIWHVIMGFGHSPAHACLFAPEPGVFIPGDLILPWITTNIGASSLETSDAGDDDPLGDYLDSLARFGGLLPENCLILPSHGEPFYGVHSRIRELLEHHAKRLGELADICSSTAQTPFQIMQRLFNRPLGPLDTFFALGETIAHIKALMLDGRLTRLEENGQSRFIRSTMGGFHALLGTR